MMTDVHVHCPRCEALVLIPPEKLAPTIPPTLPTHLSLEVFLKREIGHRCDPATIQAQIAAEMAKVGSVT